MFFASTQSWAWGFATQSSNGVSNSLSANEVVLNTSFAQNVVKPESSVSEGISLISSGASWRMNSAALPFKKNTQPVRYSWEGNLPKDQYGPGYRTGIYPGNTYVAGQCTWYAYNRRAELGRFIGLHWGDGGGWHFSAAAAGWLVNHTPEVGAVVDLPHHVAVVEEIGLDNSIRISEMNYNYQPYNYNERWITNADTLWYIH